MGEEVGVVVVDVVVGDEVGEVVEVLGLFGEPVCDGEGGVFGGAHLVEGEGVEGGEVV